MSDKGDRNILEELVGGIKKAVNPENQDEMKEKVEDLKKSEKKVDNIGKKSSGVGVDIGTSRIVGMIKDQDGNVKTENQLNAFVKFPYSVFAKEMLEKKKMKFKMMEDSVSVLGYDAQEFANIFNNEVRRPMQKGLLKSGEPEAIPVIKSIIDLVVSRPVGLGEQLSFSVPSPQAGHESDLIFHESILKKYFVGLGYKTKSITEAQAVVLSELSEHNFTGIGISMGAGMCNICFSFLSVPIIVFSIPRGGDDIDTAVGNVANETKNRVRVIKEESLDLSKSPANIMENAFHIYYEDLIMNLLKNLTLVLSKGENMPKLDHSIPIILAGGTSMPIGFVALFNKILKQITLPIKISEVSLASDPLRATARGALIDASA